MELNSRITYLTETKEKMYLDFPWRKSNPGLSLRYKNIDEI